MKSELDNSHDKGTMEKSFTLIALTDNHPGVLHRLTSAFTRRGVNIESLTVAATEKRDVSRFTIVFETTPEESAQLLKAVRRFEEVIDVSVHEDQQLLFKEIAFLQLVIHSVPERKQLEATVWEHQASIIMSDETTVTIEKTGHEGVIDAFKEALRGFEIHAFVRSGRIAIPRNHDPASTSL